ncbi:MAG: hypothetical protein WBA93_15435 [Microcoleaceae cyanobacterium]
MNYSRRDFHQLAMQFSLGLGIAPILSKYFHLNLSENLLENKVKEFFAYLDPEVDLLIPTYLGNDQRRFYGRGKPEKFQVVDKFKLGTGVTYVGKTKKVWSGAGWTGQPTITKDRGKTYLVIGGYDYLLRKIDIANNQEVGQYKFDDVIKGSSTIYIDETANEENRIVILQGSRTGRPKKGIAPKFSRYFF